MKDPKATHLQNPACPRGRPIYNHKHLAYM